MKMPQTSIYRKIRLGRYLNKKNFKSCAKIFQYFETYRGWNNRCISDIFAKNFNTPVSVGQKHFCEMRVPLDAINGSHVARINGRQFLWRGLCFAVARNNFPLFRSYHKFRRHSVFIFKGHGSQCQIQVLFFSYVENEFFEGLKKKFSASEGPIGRINKRWRKTNEIHWRLKWSTS